MKAISRISDRLRASGAGQRSLFDQEFFDGTRHVIYPWNQSKIENRKSSSPRIYPWGQSKI
jgi:hypothetical protein